MPTRIDRLNLLVLKVFWRACLVVALSVTASAWVMAEEDPYLSAITKEASKVDGATQTTLENVDSPPISADGGPSIGAFEEDLKARYKGSYTFYRKLPRRTQEEVFEEYRQGASIGEIRQKIMDRFLNR